MTLYKSSLFILLFSYINLYAENQLLEPVKLQLQWKHQFEYAGFYAAKEKGFYEDAGLDVSFVEHDATKSIIDEVLNDNAQYGLSYSSIFVEYLRGKPLVFVANFFKQSPLVLVVQEEIKSPADLKGKKVMGVSDSIDNITLLAMLEKFDIHTQDIIDVPETFNIDDFVDKKVDALSVYTTNELYQLDQKGVKYNIFDPIAYGAKYYDVNLFTTRDELIHHPERVKKFKSASIKGWEYALDHPEEIIDLIIDKYNSQKKSREALHFEAKQIEQIMLPNIYDIGSIDIDRVMAITDSFLQAGFIDDVKNKDLEAFIYDYKVNPLGLTDRELAFVQDHPKIVLGTDKRWKPYVLMNRDGTISGYDADVLRLINQASGANFVLQAGDWTDMQVKAKAREIDGLSTGSIHDERKSYLNFSDIYITMRKMVITSKENPKNIQTLNDLDGKSIAIHRSNLMDEKTAQKFPKSEILRFDSIEEVISSVATGKADAMFGNGSVFYLANELGLPYLKRSVPLDDTLDLAFGVRKDWPEAIGIINKSLDYIGRYKLLELRNRWFWDDKATLLADGYEKLQLTEQEEKYLLQKKVITMCIDPDRMPLDSIHDGKQVGINKSFIDIVKHAINVPIQLVPTESWIDSITLAKNRKCDILSLLAPTEEKKQYLNFTTPYLKVPVVIATRLEQPTIVGIQYLKNVEIAVVKGYAFVELIKQNYPNINVLEVDSLVEGLRKVREGKVYGVADSLTSVGYQFQKGLYADLKINGTFDKKLALAFGVRNDDLMLFKIFQKAVEHITPEQKEDILEQWFSVKYKNGLDYALFWKIILLIALVLLISQYILRQYNTKLKIEVAQKIEELRQKDEILLKKYRMAAMGEMLSMIAHQWQQPLSAISSSIIGIKVKLENGKFNLDDKNDRERFLGFLDRKHKNIDEYVQYLSITTNDFRNFFNPHKHKDTVLLETPIKNALNIIQASLQKNAIEIVTDFQVGTELPLYQNEVMQVILNLLKNCEDNFLEQQIQNAKITIRTYISPDNASISICDNGGGIHEEIIERIFEPYFTTKDEKNGTGLGLYMSKVMIEEHHDGLLDVQNTTDGVCFKIHFKLTI